MIVKTWGDSFLFGNDLHDDGRDTAWGTPSQHTWPALISRRLGAQYACYALGGCGNLSILDRVMLHAGCNDTEVLYIIGWTFSSRHDYVPDEKYHRARRADQYLDHFATLQPIHDDARTQDWYRHWHSPYTDKLLSLTYMVTAIDMLEHKKIPFVMTCMDETLFAQDWDAHPGIRVLQDRVNPYITRFENQDFLNWSRTRGFAISAMNHPLEPAHAAAADLIWPVLKSIIAA